ncbi:MAG: 23S rRNA (adenine(2503)-C(2))-methyltransferase RlmN [Bacteroidales bacterium]|nr:23S rRNA (adenine(2503)-C(2))-methyltransferase RlmN [Bacteroidales bacterium]
MTTLLGLSLAELQAFCLEQGFQKFTAKQLCDWMYQKRIGDFDAMTNLSLKIRARLNDIAQTGFTTLADCQTSTDGTKKYLFPIEGKGHVESVYIPDGDRATLCVSCQCGCKMGCRFCVTGQQGFHGSLTAAEILNQIFSIPESQELTNIVFMGMGEPMDNYDAIRRTLDVLTADWGLAWSPHRITVSTVGITPMLQRLIEETQVDVAVSLHNPFPDQRQALMPMEKAYPIKETIALLRRYNWRGQRRISFEYTMFGGLNDSTRHAAELVRLLKGLPCRVNLIRFHASPGTPYRTSDQQTINTFRDYLNAHGITCTLRASRGEDIMAACGLLAGKKKQEQNL